VISDSLVIRRLVIGEVLGDSPLAIVQ